MMVLCAEVKSVVVDPGGVVVIQVVVECADVVCLVDYGEQSVRPVLGRVVAESIGKRNTVDILRCTCSFNSLKHVCRVV